MQKHEQFCIRKFINPTFFFESVKTKKPIKNDGLRFLAETEGFEPSIQLPVYKLSRLARSTTLTSLLFYSKSNFPACSPDSYRDDHSDILLFYSHSNFPACSPNSYRDDHFDILLFYSHSNYSACSPNSYRDDLNYPINRDCKNRKKTTGNFKS